MRSASGISRGLRRALAALVLHAALDAAGQTPNAETSSAVFVQTTVRVAAHSVQPPYLLAGFFPAGARLEILGEGPPGYVRVRYRTAEGRVIESLCREPDVPLPPGMASDAAEPGGPPGMVYKDRNWLEDAAGYKEAVRLQSRFQVPLLIHFYADWNEECRLADRELLNETAFKNATKYVIKVRINPEHGDDEGKLAARYEVRGYPTTLVIDKPHAEPRKIRLVRRTFGRFKTDSVEYALAKIRGGVVETQPKKPPVAAAAPAASGPSNPPPGQAEAAPADGFLPILDLGETTP